MTEALFAIPRKVHLIGIGGAGMSAIARALHGEGHRISGSDLVEGPAVAALREEGVEVHAGHDRARLPDDADLVIFSAAVLESNPELAEARRRRLPVLKYAEALGGLMEDRTGIAVAGAHGKTTTTALLAYVLDGLGEDPTFCMGGEVSALGGASRVGRGPHLVAEACEYDRSFLHLSPRIAVVTNIDEDHLDYYSGIADITEAFLDFARLVPKSGLLVTLNEHEAVFREAEGVVAAVETVGIGGHADWSAHDVRLTRRRTRFTIRRGREEVARVSTRLPGYHNVLNCLSVLAVAARLGHDPGAVAPFLGRFTGVSRRLETKYEFGGITVLDDYAHHPAEIRASLGSIRSSWPGARIWCVFQPHQASRTRFLLREFAAALAGADRVVVPDIYFARDSDEEKRQIHSLDLVKKVMNLGGDARYVEDFAKIETLLLSRLRPNDVLVTMGAGDIHRVAESVAARLHGFGEWRIPALAAGGA
jgi:UDP-N-acetylmuramate--alanine ligase